MGILNGGIFDGFNGRVGRLVSYRLLNRDVIRQVGVNNKPPSLKQLVCRQQMAVVIRFLYPINGFINTGFGALAQQADKYAHNMAVSYNKKYALKGDYPEIEMDYSKVMVSQGPLVPADDPLVELADEGLKFSWQVRPDMDWPERSQRVMMMAYFPRLEKAVYTINGAKRFAGADILPLNAQLKSAYAECYLSFIEPGGNNVAGSVYAGVVNSTG